MVKQETSREQINSLPQAQKEFTDRTEPRRAFWDAYKKFTQDMCDGKHED